MTERLNDSSKRCVWSISCLMKSFWDHVHIGVWVGEGLLAPARDSSGFGGDSPLKAQLGSPVSDHQAIAL